MEELGYVTLLKDEKGNKTREFDWSKTKAVFELSSGGCCRDRRGPPVFFNTSGREKQNAVSKYPVAVPNQGQRAARNNPCSDCLGLVQSR